MKVLFCLLALILALIFTVFAIVLFFYLQGSQFLLVSDLNWSTASNQAILQTFNAALGMLWQSVYYNEQIPDSDYWSVQGEATIIGLPLPYM